MRRDAALAPLSRDHHQALVEALRLKRADSGSTGQIARDALRFWEVHGSLHFRVEEEVLLPAYAEKRDPADEAVVRVLVDHVWIRSRMERLRGPRPPEVHELRELGERLDAHVRHEERVLFPLIEAAMSESELRELARRVEEAESAGEPLSPRETP